ncbi:MAG TPA: tetratricopeptide repeat protein [Blastocatellia bacterium]|nr:tetratricopeptide repeat protein [Blastocatellia bacterium]
MVSEEISHYRIVRKLGAGGMGEVYLAEDLILNRKVAIKMLPSRSLGNEQAKRRLFREAQAAATLDHPNICPIHEVGEEGDSSFIVMQYVEGNTLASAIRNNPLSPAEIVDIGVQTAAALAEAHSHGIIHRDIKPQNIIVTPRGQVKVLDFGLAKIVADQTALTTSPTESRLTDTGEVVGTVGYMSPEQLKDLPIDARSDLFSLGVTLYECATGSSAFSGSSKIQISLQVIQFDPPRPSLRNPEIPFGLDKIILKAMAKDPYLRYQSAGELLADLLGLQKSIQEGTASQTRQLTPEPGSSRRTFAGSLQGKFLKAPTRIKIGFLVVALVAAGVLAAIGIRRSPYQPAPEARGWYERGADAIRAGAYYQASKSLERSVQIDNRFALAHARLADAYLEMDFVDRAMEELLHAMSLVPDRSSLTSGDALYLDAIAATVRRDFPSAIEHYGKIAQQAADNDRAAAYVDLGRAYEKNENISRAIEYYAQATKADPQSAAAFLRLAVLYGRSQDLKNATDALDKAETIYQAMSSEEGLTEVLYQRGALLSRMRKLPEAQNQLEAALQKSQSLDNKYQSVRTQLQLSTVYAAQGNTQKAKDTATSAIALAQANKIRNLATNGLIDLGDTLRFRGEFKEAANYFTQALEFAQTDRARRTEARAKYFLGAVSLPQGEIDKAIPLLEEALEFYQTAGYRLETSNALLMLGRAHRDKGEYDVALDTFEKLLKLARDLGDPAREAAVQSSIGILLGIEQERYGEALPHFDESYKINELRGAKADMGYNQTNRATLLWQLGRYDEARHALDSALKIADQPEAGYKLIAAWAHATDSQMELSRLQFDQAKAKGERALELAGTQAKDLVLAAKYTIGLAQAYSGAPQPAKKLCEEAVTLAREVKSPRMISSALLALAEVLLKANDAEGARANAQQAQALFAKAGQQDSEWRALLIAARAAKLSGNSEAREYASRADNLYNGLRERLGAEAFDTYRRRPDIMAYRNQLTEFLARSK